jgi:hypothetical protein
MSSVKNADRERPVIQLSLDPATLRALKATQKRTRTSISRLVDALVHQELKRCKGELLPKFPWA